jgi:lipopolysaccharide transport system ATP-binding protein
MSDTVLRAVDLGKKYQIGGEQQRYRTLRDAIVQTAMRPIERIRHPGAATHISKDLWALRHVDIEVARGEVLGVIGRNGSGKSTLLKILSRITEPSEGRVEIRGRVGSLLEVGTGFHMELTGRENIQLNGAILGMSRAEMRSKFDEIVEFSEIGKFLDTPVKRYSSGMYVRLAFAVAAHLEPEILVIDEVLAVGDIGFQQKCLGKIGEVGRKGRTVLFVSHQMGAIRTLCNRAVLLDGGLVKAVGPVDKVVGQYVSAFEAGVAPTSWPTGEGPGDEYCRFVGLEIRQQGELVGSAARTSCPLEVLMTVDVGVASRALQVGFDVLTMDGAVLLQSCHSDVADHAELAPGRHTLVCSVPGGLLNSGLYRIRPRASLYHTRWILGPDTAVDTGLQLVFDHSESTMWHGGREGTIAPALSWRLEETAVTPPSSGS